MLHVSTILFSILMSSVIAEGRVTMVEMMKPDCVLLKDMLAVWKHNHTDIERRAYSCSIDRNYSLILTNFHGEGIDNFIDLDLYFKCSSTDLTFDFIPPVSPAFNKSILLTLRMDNCNISWRTISEIGRYVCLHHVFIVINETFWNMNPLEAFNQTGLENINQLQLRLDSSTLNYSISLEEILPKDFTSPAVANLVLHCYNSSTNESYDANPECDKNVFTYNASHLPIMFPKLQGLFLQGVSSTIPRTHIFPWTDDIVKLPFGISRTMYEQNLYTNGIIDSVEPDEYRRLQTIRRLQNFDATYYCKLSGKLSRIDLNYINVDNITEQCFHRVVGLSIMDLSYNNISSIAATTFSNMTSLRQLYLNSNRITSEGLGLYNKQQNRFAGLWNLTLLDLSDNNLTILWKDIFQDLVSLESCSLENNQLTSIETSSFPRHSLNITLINVRRNQLTRLPIDCLRFPLLRKCDCDFNNISFAPEEFVGYLDAFNPFMTYLWDPLAYYGEPFSYYAEGLAHDTDQTEISLEYNQITTIPYKTTFSIEKKKKLAALLEFIQINLGKDGYLVCDLSLLEFRNFLLHEADALLTNVRLLHTKKFSVENFNTWNCQTYRILGGNQLPFLKASNQTFLNLNSLDGRCPHNCTCYNGYYLNKIYVDCYNATLVTMPKNLPLVSSAEFIVSLERNRISEIPNCNDSGYEWLSFVTELNLHDNHLTDGVHLTMERFLGCLKRIQVLDLSQNNIRFFPQSIRSMNLTKVRISDNSIDCCGASWLKEWLQDLLKTNMTDPDIPIVHCAQPNAGVPVISLEHKDFVCSQSLVTSISVLFVTLFLLVSVTFTYFYRKDLQIKLFTAFSLRLFDQDDDQVLKTCKYDAYIMYSDKDYVWAQRTLLKGLECMGFSVYDKHRNSDFSDLGAQIEDALSFSQRVIIVLSPNFLSDENSLQEFDRAVCHHKNKKKTSRFVVLVSLFPTDATITIENTKEHLLFLDYLKHGCYAEAYTKNFWRRLLYWLPDPMLLPDSLANIESLQHSTAENNSQSVMLQP